MLKVFVANSFSFNGSLAVFLSVLGKYLKSAIVEIQWDVMRAEIMSSFEFFALPPKMFNVCKNMCRRKTFALIISVSTKFFSRVQNIILQAFQTQSLLSSGRKCS